MKRILVFISLLLPIVASAQFVTNAEMILPQSNEIYYKQKIKKLIEDRFIVMSQDVSGNYSFYTLNKGEGLTRRITIANTMYYTINDFDIIKNILYFCGSFVNSYGVQEGMIGRMSIDDTVLQNITDSIIELPTVRSVTKIKTKIISGAIHVYGIGKLSQYPSYQENNCIIDLSYPSVGQISCYLYYDQVDITVDRFTDIDLTDKYVAVTGYQKDQQDMEVFKRACDDTSANDFEKYVLGLTGVDSIANNSFLVRHIGGDTIAIVAVKRNTISGQVATCIKMIDLHSIILHQITPLFNREIACAYYPIKAMEYCKYNNSLLMLQNKQTNADDIIIYGDLSIPILPTVTAAVVYGAQLNDLCLHGDLIHYNAIGIANNGNKLFWLNWDVNDTSTNCIYFSTLPVVAKPLETHIYSGIPQHQIKPFVHYYHAQLTNEPINLICH